MANAVKTGELMLQACLQTLARAGETAPPLSIVTADHVAVSILTANMTVTGW